MNLCTRRTLTGCWSFCIVLTGLVHGCSGDTFSTGGGKDAASDADGATGGNSMDGGDQVACSGPEDCDDSDANTLDLCGPSGTCTSEARCPEGTNFCDGTCAECCSSKECDDGIDCTANVCLNGSCAFAPRDADCGATEYCSPEAGCKDRPSCEEASECPKENACVATKCEEGLCQFNFCDQPKCCGDGTCGSCCDASDCDDGNGCTQDSCEAGTCQHAETSCFFGECCESTGACGVCCKSSDCKDDGIACTDTSCLDGTCQHVNNCPSGKFCNHELARCEAPGDCGENEDCDDDNICTVDSCKSEQCKHTDCSASGLLCDPTSGCYDPGSGTGGGSSTGGNGNGSGGFTGVGGIIFGDSGDGIDFPL